jgi:hypothetical protein
MVRRPRVVVKGGWYHAYNRVATFGVERWRQKRTALAEVLNKDPDVVSVWAGEGARRGQHDAGTARALDDLDERLSTSVTETS